MQNQTLTVCFEVRVMIRYFVQERPKSMAYLEQSSRIIINYKLIINVFVCVCVCMCVRERESL
jgi:hypothetical protein